MDTWPTPHFRSGWDSYFKNKPDKPVMHYSVIAGYVHPCVTYHIPRDNPFSFIIYFANYYKVGLVTTC